MNGLETSGGRICLAARHIRVTRNGRFTQKQKENNPATFAARFFHQHERHWRRWPLITLVLSRPAQPGLQPLSTQKHQWRLRTNLSLTLINNYPVLPDRQDAPARLLVEQPDLPAPLNGRTVMKNQRLNLTELQSRTVIKGHQHHELVRLTKKMTVRQREQLVERLAQRFKRTEQVQSLQPTLAETASGARKSARAQAPPVPQLFRRQTAAAPNAAPALPSDDFHAPQAYRRVSSSSRKGNKSDIDAAMANLDLHNLTDQIIRNIDQRVIAYRERRGKI